jgi:hypothetical protein
MLNPIDKIVKLNNTGDYKVTGVMKDPKNFRVDFNTLASFEPLGNLFGPKVLNSFDSWNVPTYVLLLHQYNASDLAHKVINLFNGRLATWRRGDVATVSSFVYAMLWIGENFGQLLPLPLKKRL